LDTSDIYLGIYSMVSVYDNCSLECDSDCISTDRHSLLGFHAQDVRGCLSYSGSLMERLSPPKINLFTIMLLFFIF